MAFLGYVAVLLFATAGLFSCTKPAATPHAKPLSVSRPQDASVHRADGATDSRVVLDAASFSETPPVAMHLDPGGVFFGRNDRNIRERLATGEIAKVERGYGGRSVAFKIQLQDGTRGYYKPEQTFSAAHWYGEVAAYYLDRELGLGRVPPVVGRRMAWEPLRQSAPSDERFVEVVVGKDGSVRGAFMWWVPDKLVSLRLGRGWEKWLRVEGWPSSAISPFQRARVYAEASFRKRHPESLFADGGGMPLSRAGAGLDAATAPASSDLPAESAEPTAGEPDTAARPAELSDMVLFDFLTLNMDRWGGDNTNVRTKGPGGALVFIDNAAGFSPAVRLGVMDARLRVVQRFRRSTVEAIRALDVASFVRRMNSDPLAPVLTPAQIHGLKVRCGVILEHVASMQAKFGDAVFW